MTPTLPPDLALALAVRERRRRSGPSSRSFDEWLPQVTPTYHWEWRHLAHIREALDRVTRGEIKRLMLFVPPRHGKSEMVTIRYPVWRLEENPTQRVIIGAYNATLAAKFSRKARNIARQRLALNTERTAVEDWETLQGGGVRAVGVGGGITGMGANLIVIDDPVKSREEANSEVYRNRVYDWYTDDLYTRLEPGGAIILIMTRWHEDDLAGRILASDDGPNWTVIKLPAEAEADDPLGRVEGAALCPERYDEAALAEIKRVLLNNYYALYQQRPQPVEGSFFKRQWFEIVDGVPFHAQRVRWWDQGATADDGDYTAGVLVARAVGMYYVEDVVRGQWSSAERDAIILQTAELDAQRYGNTVHYWSGQEPGSGGKDQARAFVRLLAGYTVSTEPESGDKIVRADPFRSQAEAGNAKLKRGNWNGPYLDELTSFPTGKHDDQVDGTSGAFNKVALAPQGSRTRSRA